MNLVSLILGINFLLITNSCKHIVETEKSEISVNVKIKGCYELPQFSNGREAVNDSIYYYFIEINILNEKDHKVEFLIFNCNMASNLVLDVKNVWLAYNNCWNDTFRTIELSPQQQLIIPVLLLAHKKKIPSEIRIGWFQFSPDNINKFNDTDLFYLEKKKTKNIIWSDPFKLSPATNHDLFEIE